ncbi:hypothetical protein POM88_024463 [Heracleum sosnowskyi]|uniref:NB-ARC domain-containing protein n=1 Tax=Heracleum sosnowskyi TaxID=360622 RepID=A0AAD8MMB5_9APIA|nr:hypothetical protein POM88_024463 [Heracleum sosnowskyi]
MSCLVDVSIERIRYKLCRLWWYQRYLIVLDVAHAIDGAIKTLCELCPNQSNGSKLLITTAKRGLLTASLDCYIHERRVLGDDEAWELFNGRLDFQVNQEVEQFSRDIAKKCSGLVDQPVDNGKTPECAGSSFPFLSFDSREGPVPEKDIGNFIHRGIKLNCLRKLRVLDLKDFGFETHLPSGAFPFPFGSCNSYDMSTFVLECENYRSRIMEPGRPISLLNMQTLWGAFVDD